MNVTNARSDLASGHPSLAVQLLKKRALTPGDSQLVYLLDYATALQLAGHYKQSNQAFHLADQLSEVKDYYSISRISESLLLNQGMVQYKGDDYEKVLINAFSAINYLMLNDLDDALVEVRRLNEKLYLYKTEAKRNYDQNVFAIYLGGVIWEASHDWDDAYISYHDAYKLDPTYAPLKTDLIRAADMDQRPQALRRWEKRFPKIKINPVWNDPKESELIFIYQQGWGPRKVPRPQDPRFPELIHVPTNTRYAQLDISGIGKFRTTQIYSVEKVAEKTLNDEYAALVASRLAGIATKAIVANQIAQKNRLLGNIAWIAMNMADRADLRQWSTLPQTFQLARVFLKPGTYQVKVVGLDRQGAPTGENMAAKTLKIPPGKKIFLTWRSFR